VVKLINHHISRSDFVALAAGMSTKTIVNRIEKINVFKEMRNFGKKRRLRQLRGPES